jgi:hypothetical protein
MLSRLNLKLCQFQMEFSLWARKVLAGPIDSATNRGLICRSPEQRCIQSSSQAVPHRLQFMLPDNSIPLWARPSFQTPEFSALNLCQNDGFNFMNGTFTHQLTQVDSKHRYFQVIDRVGVSHNSAWLLMSISPAAIRHPAATQNGFCLRKMTFNQIKLHYK